MLRTVATPGFGLMRVAWRRILYKHRTHYDFMVNRYVKEAIKTIYKKIGHDIKWALVGSTNMQIQGMQIEPRDLDIVIQHKDLEKVSRIFSDYSASKVIKLKTLSGKPAWEVRATINDVKVQFFGGDEKDIYVSELLSGKIIMIELDGTKIPCFTLEAESQTYKETNREHKTNLIQKFLDTRKGN